MKILKGIVSSKGVVFGKSIVVDKDIVSIRPYIINDVEAELNQFLASQQKSIEQLNKLYKESILMVSKNEAVIFKSHEMMIKDPDFVDKILYYIKVFKYNAGFAIFKASNDYIDLLQNLGVEYISQRTDDIKDVMRRLIKNLGEDDKDVIFNITDQGILVTQELMPSEILTLDKTKVLGIVTKYGGQTSHTSILAKSFGIPMLVGVDFVLDDFIDKTVILDSINGKIIIDPERAVLNNFLKRQIDINKNKSIKWMLVNRGSLTIDKKEIKVMANIGLSTEVKEANDNGAQGIGLFRSEFLYMNRNSLPSEEDLFLEYKAVLIGAGDKDVIIRTIDLGSDKNVSYMKLPKEENPALGLRALRLCFEHMDIFKTQLRALVRASIYGNLFLLIPMVVSVAEIIKVKKIITEVKDALKAEQQPFKDKIPIGIMIETPAAVMISDLLAKQVDFFSIGTNDLMQYTLACDRDNEKMTDIFNHNNIAVLRMIKMVVDNAHKNDIWVEVCGEVAGDQIMTGKLIGLDVDRLSVDLQNILPIKDTINRTNYLKVKKNILESIYPK